MSYSKVTFNLMLLILLVLLAGCVTIVTEPTLDDVPSENEEGIDIEDKLTIGKKNYDNLPIVKQVLLAASVVDERASEGAAAIIYNIEEEGIVEGDSLYVTIQSDIDLPRGEPFYKILIGPEYITPIGGFKDIGATGFDYEAVDTTPVSKAELYEQYTQDKEFYTYMKSIVRHSAADTTDIYKVMRSDTEEKYRMSSQKRPYDVSYDSLPLRKKIQLIASTVDNRADMQGFHIYYQQVEDTLFVNVHSGAGVGHPIYKFKIHPDKISPIGGVVHNGIENGKDSYEEVIVDTSPINKDKLYEDYKEHKLCSSFFENSVEENGNLSDSYEGMKSEL